MKLYKVDTKLWTVRAVNGEPYPGTDTDGDTCFSNTHYPSETRAWESLLVNVSASAEFAASNLIEAKGRLADAEAYAGRMAEALAFVQQQLDERKAKRA